MCHPAGALQDTTIQFLVPDGDTTAADDLANQLLEDPTAVLPPDTWGAVEVSNLEQGEAEITVPRELLAPAQGGDDKTGLIVGLAVGREWGRSAGCDGSVNEGAVMMHAWHGRPAAQVPTQLLPLLQWVVVPSSWQASASGCGRAVGGFPARWLPMKFPPSTCELDLTESGRSHQ